MRYYDGIWKDKIEEEGVTDENMTLLANEFIRTPFAPKRSPWEAFLGSVSKTFKKFQLKNNQ